MLAHVSACWRVCQHAGVPPTRITVLAGGVGGARFLRGLRLAAPDASITAVVNTGDDLWLTGVRVCPDLDSIMYALADVNDTGRGWGRAHESERVSAELDAYGVGWPWFTLGDLDLGTHLARTSLLREGMPLSQVTERLCARWGIDVTLLPMSDEEVETWVEVEDAEGGIRSMHFEEWWVRHRAALPARRFTQRGVNDASPAPGVLEAITGADAVLLAPSNPVVSIGTILGVPGIRDAVRATRAPVVGLSPIIGGAAVRGMAEACLSAIGVTTSADAVARHYGARSVGARASSGVAGGGLPGGGLLDGWLMDDADAGLVGEVHAAGIRAVARPLYLSGPEESAAIAGSALELAEQLRSGS